MDRLGLSADLSPIRYARRVQLHNLRHSHTSRAVMNGVPVPVVSRILGHANVRMTLRYAHLGDREIESEAERFAQPSQRSWVWRTNDPPVGLPLWHERLRGSSSFPIASCSWPLLMQPTEPSPTALRSGTHGLR